MVKIDFEIVHPVYGKFRDALHLPEDHGLSEEQINALQQERFNNWVTFIETPPPEETPVIEEQSSPEGE